MDKTQTAPVLGSSLLVTGCCVGAGMLGLPLACQRSSFLSSLLPLFLSWGYMYSSGLMVLEAYAAAGHQSSLLNLFETVLGNSGKRLGSILFFFLFCSLLIAYLNGFSSIIKSSLDQLFHSNVRQLYILAALSMGLIALINSKMRKIDIINRVCVSLMLMFYVLLVLLGATEVKTENIIHSAFNAKIVALAIPVFIVSFGFQNLIPLISNYLNHDYPRVKKSLVTGTTFALIVYLLWNYIILGMLPSTHSLSSIDNLFANFGNKAAMCINGFAFLAIMTSIITVAISFTDFVSNKKDQKSIKFLRSLFIILVPASFAIMGTDIFLKALHIAGGIAAVSLFGLFPSWMLWKMRYVHQHQSANYFPFGKKAILAHVVFSLAILVLEISHLLNFM